MAGLANPNVYRQIFYAHTLLQMVQLQGMNPLGGWKERGKLNLKRGKARTEAQGQRVRRRVRDSTQF